MTIIRVWIALLFLLGYTAAQAAEFYRYVDTNGVTVISRLGVPSDVIGNGYEVINAHGRVVRVVPRALTAEEHRQLQEEKQQAEIDRQLLRLYSKVSDVERAEERKQAEIDSFIGLIRRNMEDVQEDKAVLLNQAGNHERAGRKVPDELLEKISQLERRERGYLEEIKRYQQLRVDVVQEFALDKQRVEFLLNARKAEKKL